VTNVSLAQSYLVKARIRLTILPVLHEAAAYSDVVRESQEIVELALKGMLRQAGVEPPHWHDVGGLLQEHASRFRALTPANIERAVAASAWLRKEREFAFYGDIDFIPPERYDAAVATRAIDDARAVVALADRIIVRPPEFS
jgi:HEPN domain-containing protein